MNFDKNEKDDIHNYHAEECFYIELPKRGQCRWVGWTGGYERTGLYNANESYAALFQMDVLECDEMKQFIGNDEYILHSVDEHICSHRRRIIRRENLKIIHKKWDIELEQLKLNRKTLCCLKKSGIYTVDELVNTYPDEFVYMRNFGRETAIEIDKKLKLYEIPFDFFLYCDNARLNYVDRMKGNV